MKIYTCCPDENCGAFDAAQRWLKSYGLEPSIGKDNHGHYLEFETPKDWTEQQLEEFREELAKRSSDGESRHARADTLEEGFAHVWILDSLLTTLAGEYDAVSSTTMDGGFTMSFDLKDESLCELVYLDEFKILRVGKCVTGGTRYALYWIASEYDLELREEFEGEEHFGHSQSQLSVVGPAEQDISDEGGEDE